jgi:predicted nuclease of predicted toxin-antitoxin system
MIRAPDSVIVQKAREEGRIVLTCDLDFGEILALSQLALPSIVIFRLSDYRPCFLNPLLAKVLQECAGTLTAGALIVIEDHRYRIRHLPIKLD